MNTITIEEPARILIVDDMVTNRELVKQLLRSNIYHTSEAKNGEEALEKIFQHSYDIILLDIMMPKINGFEVVKRLREIPEYKLTPIILLTSLGSPDDISKGMEIGATDYICKPFNGNELKARVNAAVENKRLMRRLDDTETVLFTLARMLDDRDQTAVDHCERLSHMCVVFGNKIGLNLAQHEALRKGSVLHDIGKLGIPDSILLKNDKLTDKEWAVMKQHTSIGASLCAPLQSMRMTIDIIKHHHERWDGSGYPDGLKEENIPLLARIFQIVDIYDALRSERPYKPAFSNEKAIEIMNEEMGHGKLDPLLTKMFIEIVRNNPEIHENIGHTNNVSDAPIMDEIF